MHRNANRGLFICWLTMKVTKSTNLGEEFDMAITPSGSIHVFLQHAGTRLNIVVFGYGIHTSFLDVGG